MPPPERPPIREPAARAAQQEPPAAPARRQEIPLVFRDEGTYSLELRGAELAQAFHMIGAMGGVNLLLLGDFKEPVAGAFPGVRLQSAFATFCDVHDCRVQERNDIWMVSRADPAREETRLFELENVTAQSVEGQLKTLLGTSSTVVVNPGSNVISATASADRLGQAERFLAAVDRLDRQVLIECTIVEVDEDDLIQIGVEIDAGDISIDDTTLTFLSSFLSQTPNIIATGSADHSDVDAALEALASDVDLKVVSRPKLLCLNNKDAKLDVISEVPYVQATTTTTGNNTGTGTVTVQEVQFKEIGLKLTVTPAIQEDGHIGLHVVQAVSEQTGTFLTVPVVDSRTIDDWFLVREGDTLRIGGILRERTRHEVRGIPWLMDVPLLGHLFRFESDEVQTLDLEILITPRIVESAPPDAAGEARVDLPGE
jgi:type II secretory pathway component GspD/PulD (secretin)